MNTKWGLNSKLNAVSATSKYFLSMLKKNLPVIWVPTHVVHSIDGWVTLSNYVIPDLQELGCVDRIIFKQDGATPHIVNPVKHLIKRHFRNARIISHHFSTAWSSRSPGPNPCDFWLWSYLKDVLFSTPIAYFAEMKAHIEQHILNVTPETLRTKVENTVSRFQLLAKNGEQHVEHVLHHSREI